MKRPPKDDYPAWDDDRDRQQDAVYDEVQRSIYHRIQQEEIEDDAPFWESNQSKRDQNPWGDGQRYTSDRERYHEERAHLNRRDDCVSRDRRVNLYEDEADQAMHSRRVDPYEDEQPPRRRRADAYGEERSPRDRSREGEDYRPSPSFGGERKPPSGSRSSRTAAPRSKKRKTLRILLIVLFILAALAFAVHGVLVRPPKLPSQAQSQGQTQEQGTHPDALGKDRKQDVYTFLLVGRDDGGGGNTDTIMVGAYDVKNRTIDILSIYRDTMVDVPWDISKINSVYNRQGLEGLQKQIKNLIGYVPDYHFVVELSMIPALVDAMGGVTYDVPYNMDYDDPTQDLHIHFKKGPQHLSGEDAVKLLRWRKNNSGESLSVGDIGRVEVQHSFLKAMAKQMLSLGTITRLIDIIKVVDQNLESNLNYGEMIWFAEQALGVKGDSIRFHNLPGDPTGTKWSSTYKNNQSYVFVNDQVLLNLVNQYMNPYTSDITSDMQHIIHATTVDTLTGSADQTE